ncbi:anti-sigma factor family protein [candidate division CSSED10-310 bacterium]|uniref:Anti-sigma factor family protein n=1 Tax=candidate division CSSED10-310 bacterium TaxID=2855610 RepID=A0ABV6Z0C5_UNCC1
MMNCKEIKSLLPDYLENMLNQDRKVSFEKHLTQCQNCAQIVRSYQLTLEMIERDTEPVRSEKYWRTVETAVQAKLADAPVPARRIFFHWSWAIDNLGGFSRTMQLGAGFAVMLILTVGMFSLFPHHPDPDLSPSGAIEICDDPQIWSATIWLGSDSVESLEPEISADNEDIDTLLLSEIFDLQENQDMPLTHEDESDTTIFSLIDQLDEQGQEMLISELKKFDKV